MTSIYEQRPDHIWTIRDIMAMEHRLERATDPDERAALLRWLAEAKRRPEEPNPPSCVRNMLTGRES